MKTRRVTLLILFSVAVSGPMMLPATENSSLSEVEQEVWALEEAYISAFRDAKHDEIISMLHRDFLGWPLERVRPSRKGDVAEFLRDNYPHPLELSFEIDRMGIRVSEDVVITHYLLTIRGKDGSETGQPRSIRITHTWIKQGSDWRILGGMSSVQ